MLRVNEEEWTAEWRCEFLRSMWFIAIDWREETRARPAYSDSWSFSVAFLLFQVYSGHLLDWRFHDLLLDQVGQRASLWPAWGKVTIIFLDFYGLLWEKVFLASTTLLGNRKSGFYDSKCWGTTCKRQEGRKWKRPGLWSCFRGFQPTHFKALSRPQCILEYYVLNTKKS